MLKYLVADLQRHSMEVPIRELTFALLEGHLLPLLPMQALGALACTARDMREIIESARAWEALAEATLGKLLCRMHMHLHTAPGEQL